MIIISPQTVVVGIGYSITAIISAALLLVILWHAPRQRSNQLFALMMLMLSAYSVLNIYGRFLPFIENSNADLLYRVTIVLYTGSVVLLFFFAVNFAGMSGQFARLLQGLTLVANGVMIILTFTDQFVKDYYPLSDGSGGYNFTPGPAFLPLALVHIIYLMLLIVVFFRAEEKRARRLWPAVALIMAGVVGLFLRPIIPLPLNAIFLAAAAMWIGYTVLDAQLFNPLAELNRELASTNVELAKTNQELAKANRLKNQFLANMSHELRTPLNSIIGYTELVLNGTYGSVNERQSDRLQRVVRNGRHLLGLINDILDLSKIEAGRMQLALAPLETPEILESVVATLEPHAQTKALSINREFENAPQIQGDETRVRQIFMNLLSNAVKFTNKGQITIHCTPEPNGGLVTFYVQDTGIGIPPEKQHMIFEEFRQLDDSATRRFQGTGLGLAITRHLVEMHGGKLWVESEVNQGTTFYLTLPAAQPVINMQPGNQPSPAHYLPAVLAIDSSESDIHALREHLDNNGFRVHHAKSGPEGLAYARETRPDLIIMDAMMPGIDGWKTLQSLKQDPITAPIPVIMVDIQEPPERAVPLAANAVLTKPIDKHHLLDTVRQALAERADSPILVVDDNESDRALLAAMLTSAGYEAVTVGSGQAACDWLLEHHTSLVVLDLMMPDVTGFDVLQFIRDNKALRKTPVLVVSAKDLTLEEQAFLRARYAALIQKGDLLQDLLLAEVKGVITPP